MADRAVLAWLADGDPAVGWQAERDLLAAPEATWRATRGRVETEGWGARLLAHQDPDGQWAGGAFVPAGFDWELWQTEGQPWTATYHVLTLLRGFGLEPGSDAARRTTDLVGRHSRWDHAGQPFWEGEVEPCINGITLANGAYFGVDVDPIVQRLLADQRPDGGWNCEEESAVSSFDSTINVLEGLLAWLRSVRAADGTWPLQARLAGRDWFELEPVGQPSRWITLYALRVLRWWDGG